MKWTLLPAALSFWRRRQPSTLQEVVGVVRFCNKSFKRHLFTGKSFLTGAACNSSFESDSFHEDNFKAGVLCNDSFVTRVFSNAQFAVAGIHKREFDISQPAVVGFSSSVLCNPSFTQQAFNDASFSSSVFCNETFRVTETSGEFDG